MISYKCLEEIRCLQQKRRDIENAIRELKKPFRRDRYKELTLEVHNMEFKPIFEKMRELGTQELNKELDSTNYELNEYIKKEKEDD